MERQTHNDTHTKSHKLKYNYRKKLEIPFGNILDIQVLLFVSISFLGSGKCNMFVDS